MTLRHLFFSSLKFHNRGIYLRGCIAVGCAIAIHSACLHADILHLKNGYYKEGTITEVEQGYRLKTAGSSVIYRREQVLRWEKRILPADEYLLRKADTPLDDVDGNYVLALWCKQHKLLEEARFHFQQVFRLDPNHKDARKVSGYIYKKGKWITRSESMRQQGYLRYKGKWLPKHETLALQEADRDERERKYVFEKAWKMLRLARKLSGAEAMNNLAEELAKLGPHVNMVLLQGLNEPYKQIRQVAIIALGMRPEKNSAKALCRRMRYESVPGLQKLIAGALAGHKQRPLICNQLVIDLLETESRKKRRRLIYALQVIKDIHIIPMLIRNTDFSPVKVINDNIPAPPQKQIEVPDENAPGGWRLESLQPQKNTDARKPQSYQTYPAAEALAILTDRDYGNDTEAWIKWWKKNSTTFTFGEPKRP